MNAPGHPSRRLCATPGCDAPPAADGIYCLACRRHRDVIETMTRARPILASPRTLGVERTCANCAMWVRGFRDRSGWNTLKPETGSPVQAGDCRTNPPRAPAYEDGPVFPITFEGDWCRHHTMRRDR